VLSRHNRTSLIDVLDLINGYAQFCSLVILSLSRVDGDSQSQEF